MKQLIKPLSLILCGFALIFAGCDKNEETDSDFIIDIETPYQTIEGFGTCLVNYKDFPDEYSDPEFLDRVVHDLGMSIVRIPLMEHTEWKNDDDDPDHFNWEGFWLNNKLGRKGIEASTLLLQEFKKRGVNRFMGTPWSPPDFLKTQRAPIRGGFLRADMVKEYAEYMAAQIILAKKNYGIDLNWITVQNELLFAQFYRSCVYNPWVLKEAVRALMHKFEKEGINTKILMPEDMMFIHRMLYYIEPTMNDPETMFYNGHFCTHRHGGKDQLITWVEETKHHNRQNWMTETSGHDPTWDGALEMAEDMHEYLVYGNFSAWVYWQLSGDGGRYSILVNGQPGPKYYAAKHFYRFIRPGAVRVETSFKEKENGPGKTEDHKDLMVSSYHHPYDGTLTTLIINNSDSAITTSIETPCRMEIFRSSENEEFASAGMYKSGKDLEMPAKSIVTLYGANRKLETGSEMPELPEAWVIPEGTEEGKWGNEREFPETIPYQMRADAGNVSAIHEFKKMDVEELLSTRMHNGWTLLHKAILNGDGDAVKYLIENGMDVNVAANDGWTPLHMAASTFTGNLNKEDRIEDYSKYDIFRMVMEAGADVKVTNDEGWTSLHAAVANAYTGWRDNPEYMTQRIIDLIASGANVNAMDNSGKTALHYTALQGYFLYTGVPGVSPIVAEILLDAGATPDIRDNSGKTPLHYATQMGYDDIVLSLVLNGADPQIEDDEGNTPLEIARRHELETILYILENGRAPGEDELSAEESDSEKEKESRLGPELVKAAWDGDLEKVKELIEKGADLNYRDSDGFTALERARDSGHEEVVEVLVKSNRPFD